MTSRGSPTVSPLLATVVARRGGFLQVFDVSTYFMEAQIEELVTLAHDNWIQSGDGDFLMDCLLAAAESGVEAASGFLKSMSKMLEAGVSEVCWSVGVKSEAAFAWLRAYRPDAFLAVSNVRSLARV